MGRDPRLLAAGVDVAADAVAAKPLADGSLAGYKEVGLKKKKNSPPALPLEPYMLGKKKKHSPGHGSRVGLRAPRAREEAPERARAHRALVEPEEEGEAHGSGGQGREEAVSPNAACRPLPFRMRIRAK